MINEVEFLKRCEKIREEIKIIKTRMKYINNETNTDMFHYIKGLEFSYNIMKQIGIYK